MTIQEKMKLVLNYSQECHESGDIPIAAAIFRENDLISYAINEVEKNKNPIAHAEIIAIKKATYNLNSKSLKGCEIFVNLEPCPMCAGAIVLAKIDKLYFGAYDTKTGAADSLYQITNDKRLNHLVETYGGILEETCRGNLMKFFANIRDKK